MTFITSVRKEFLELARSHRLLILAVVLILFGLTSPLMARFMPEMFKSIPGAEAYADMMPTPTIIDAITQYVKNITQFGLLLALLLSMGLVAQEKERGTAVLVLVKPLPRATFLLAKFTAMALAFLGCLVLAGVAGYVYTIILFKVPDAGGWLAMTLLLWLYMLVFIALTLLASTLVRSQAAAAGVGFGAMLILAALGAIPGLGQYLPGHLATWGAMLAGIPAAAPLAALGPALGISLGLIVLSLVAAWLLFERQEL